VALDQQQGPVVQRLLAQLYRQADRARAGAYLDLMAIGAAPGEAFARALPIQILQPVAKEVLGRTGGGEPLEEFGVLEDDRLIVSIGDGDADVQRLEYLFEGGGFGHIGRLRHRASRDGSRPGFPAS